MRIDRMAVVAAFFCSLTSVNCGAAGTDPVAEVHECALPRVAQSRGLLDPLDMRWTFGAHEPFPMYRRVGRRCTGGIDGNARWLRPWLRWWDAESPKLMKELGFNWLHSRFYKGMGWEIEKEDFPNVQKFVRNCHSNGVHALAYVQFSTCYPEMMRKEFPDIDSWAQIDENGKRRNYHDGSYFRTMPCINCRAWEENVRRMCTIALTEGGFDGIMFDNAFAYPCYCERCEKSFNEYLSRLPDRKERFGFSDLSGVRLPHPAESALNGEIRDPVVQAWTRWRTDTLTAVYKRLRNHIKSVRPDAVVSANAQPFRSFTAPWRNSTDMVELAGILDLILGQNANYPACVDGRVRSRIRDLKLARELKTPIVALCDSDSMMTPEQERHYLLPLYEDIVFGGIPTDRTIMNPTPVQGFVDQDRLARRKPQLARFNAFAGECRSQLAASVWQPVRLFYPVKEIQFSRQSSKSLCAAEEVMIRRHVPWGYFISTPAHPFDVPPGTEVVVVAGQLALSPAQVSGLTSWAQRGGKMVVTGDSGRYDEFNAQYLENPLLSKLKGLRNVVWRGWVDVVDPAELGWSYKIGVPGDHGRAMLVDLSATGWGMPFEFRNLPETTAVDVRRSAQGKFIFHFVNYDPAHAVNNASVVWPDGRRQAVPGFEEYALVEED